MDTRSKINGKIVNFIAKFEIDEGATDRALPRGQGSTSIEYNPSPKADYQWVLAPA